MNPGYRQEGVQVSGLSAKTVCHMQDLKCTYFTPSTLNMKDYE
jgi:hypothetical protein